MTTPKFPTYTGTDIPPVLQPWNPWHYWLLLKWILFQPSQLESYLKIAGTELNGERDNSKLFTYRRVFTYAKLFLFALLINIIFSLGAIIGSDLAYRYSTILEDGWPRWIQLAIMVYITSLVIPSLILVIPKITKRIDGIIKFVLPIATIIGTVVVSSFLLIRNLDLLNSGINIAFALFFFIGLLFGIILGRFWIVTLFSISLGIVVFIYDLLGLQNVLSGEINLDSLISFASISGFIAFSGAFTGILINHSLLRSLEWLLAWFYLYFPGSPVRKIVYHPAFWDELVIWPLPGTSRLLQQCLFVDFNRGVEVAQRIAVNPWQRWAIQKAFFDYFHKCDDPLRMIYQLAQPESIIDHKEAQGSYLFCHFLLGTISPPKVGLFDQSISSDAIGWSEVLVYLLGRRKSTPLTDFSKALYALVTVHDQTGIKELAERTRFIEDKTRAFQEVVSFPHGDEIAHSLSTISKFLHIQTISGLSKAYKETEWLVSLQNNNYLRSDVIEVIKACADISQQILTYKKLSNLRQQTTSLNLVVTRLQEMGVYIQEQVKNPERILLSWVTSQWKTISVKEQGKLARSALQQMSRSERMATVALFEKPTASIWERLTTPVDNPYVAGDPVYPPLLVGRTDIFNRIGEIWGAKANPDSIILYGHRRMGKSSILRNLAQAAPEKTVIAYADMQGKTSFVASTAGLLLELADQIVLALNTAYPEQAMPQPHEAEYDTPARAQRAFNLLTAQVRQLLGHKSLILALDEFEAVEKAVVGGKIGPEIYQFLRSKSMEPGLTLVFGGLHTLDEMSRDYAQPFYGSYTNIKVSYLPHREAWRLITNPNEEFPLNYEPAAVERIIAETGGQPYLVQLVCRETLDHLNHTLFDLQQERDAILTLADVEAVLDGDLFQRGMVYFDGVWSQASEGNQRHLLRTLAGRAEPWTWDEMRQASGLGETELQAALQWVERQDIVQKVGDPPVWQFYVPLLRQWIGMVKGTSR